MWRLRFVLLLVVGVLTAPPMALGKTEPTLRVMTFNVLLGGDHHYPLQATVDVIRAAGADIVGAQETDANGPRIASLLGWHWHPVARGTRPGGILSRFPFARTYSQGAAVKLPSGGVAHVFSVHLRSSPYEPYELRDGRLRTPEEAVASATAGRGQEIAVVIDELRPLVQAGEPVFLVGDFNEPSHLDWTAKAGPHAAGLHALEVRWPTSIAVERAGLKDAYRTLHADETRRPGYTWTPFHSPGEIHDRIDFVHYAGQGLTLTEARLVGEKNGPGVDIVGRTPYPSDHRAVVVTVKGIGARSPGQ